MAQTKYSEQKKRLIAADMALLGDADLVAEKHGIKPGTLKHWVKAQWFRDLLADMNSAHTDRLIAKSHRALDTALDELDDRLHRGDLRVKLFKGEPVQYREPIAARDLSAIVNVLAARSERAAQLMQGQQTNYQLADLQTSFRQFAGSYRAKQIKDNTAIPHEPQSVQSETEPE